MMERYPDSTLGKHKIMIGMLSAGMVNKLSVRHFQACESQDPSDGQFQKSKTMPTDHVRLPGERKLTR